MPDPLVEGVGAALPEVEGVFEAVPVGDGEHTIFRALIQRPPYVEFDTLNVAPPSDDCMSPRATATLEAGTSEGASTSYHATPGVSARHVRHQYDATEALTRNGRVTLTKVGPGTAITSVDCNDETRVRGSRVTGSAVNKANDMLTEAVVPPLVGTGAPRANHVSNNWYTPGPHAGSTSGQKSVTPHDADPDNDLDEPRKRFVRELVVSKTGWIGKPERDCVGDCVPERVDVCETDAPPTTGRGPPDRDSTRAANAAAAGRRIS